MATPKKEIDMDLAISLLTDGMSKKEVAGIMGVSIPTLSARIEELKHEESNLLAYSKVQHLDLISVQQKLIAGITEDKIQEAPLGQIAQAFGVFKKAEQLIEGRPTEIHGLMGYLMHLEKTEREEVKQVDDAQDAQDAEYTDA